MSLRSEITDLTVCRAIFAACVFTYHVDLHAQFSAYLGPAAGLIRHGYLGVDGFFILSGLILARVHPELAHSTASAVLRFLGKRLARIYPVHFAIILFLAIVVALGLALGFTPRDSGRFTIPSLIENLLLIQGWGFSHDLAWNYPSWSVSTEWAGYLFFPALWAGIGRWPPIIAGQIIAVCIPCLGLLAYVSGLGLNLTFADALPRFFLEFIIGIATARLVPLSADYLPSRPLAIFGFTISAVGVFAGSDFTAVFGLWLALAGLTMLADTGRSPLFGKSRFSLFLGHLSYAYYMSFGTIELLLSQFYLRESWDPAHSKLSYAAAMLCLTFALALFLNRLIEIPCRRWADRKLATPSPQAPAPVISAHLN